MSEHINRIEYYVENMSNAQRLEDLVVSKSMSNINKFIENLDENISIIAKQEEKSFTLKSQINNINLFLMKISFLESSKI